MIIALTGTPGTGKTSVSKILIKNGYEVIDLNNIANENNFILANDKIRNSKIVDIKKLDSFIKKNYYDKELIFIEGHLSHLLKSVDKVIILRCHPDKLKINLGIKNWNEKKVKENIEAEILDIILCESIDIHPENNIFEIDTSKITVNEVANKILNIIKNHFKNIKKYKIGKIDWSEEILKDS